MDPIEEKIKIIENSYDAFIKEVKEIEDEVLKQILTFIKSFIEKPKGATLSTINKILKKIINPDKFRSSVRAYLKNFDDVELLSKKILSGEIGENLDDFNLNDEKKLAIEDIVRGLLNQDMLDQNLQSPLRKLLYRYATTNITLQQAETEIRNFIKGNNNLGFAEKYVKTLAIESISRFDGSINQRIVDEFKLDAFRIVGSLIITSQPQCVEMVSQKGLLGKFKINGKFAMSDLPEIINILKSDKSYGGVHKDLNVNNYFIYRNHWFCRHIMVGTRLLKADKEALEKRGKITL